MNNAQFYNENLAIPYVASMLLWKSSERKEKKFTVRQKQKIIIVCYDNDLIPCNSHIISI